jgi:hypothetical protein
VLRIRIRDPGWKNQYPGYRFFNTYGLALIDFFGGRGRGLRLLADASQAEVRIFYRTEQNKSK